MAIKKYHKITPIKGINIKLSLLNNELPTVNGIKVNEVNISTTFLGKCPLTGRLIYEDKITITRINYEKPNKL